MCRSFLLSCESRSTDLHPTFCLKPQLFDGVFTCLTQAGAKAKKDASWDTWFGPMAINLRQLMHINLLYNSSAQSNTAVVAE
jgi:hypothetical protein